MQFQAMQLPANVTNTTSGVLYLPPHIEPLNGANYPQWALAMRPILEINSCWGFVSGNRLSGRWDPADERAAGIILLYCTPEVQERVLSAESCFSPVLPPVSTYQTPSMNPLFGQSMARQRWDYLSRTYGSPLGTGGGAQGRAREAMEVQMNRMVEGQARAFRFTESRPFQQQFTEFEALFATLRGTRFDMSNRTDLVTLVWGALPPSYIQSLGLLEPLRGDDYRWYQGLKVLVLREETRRGPAMSQGMVVKNEEDEMPLRLVGE
ncbi:hypothetical protein AX16_001506 [Volvariella volvacea WC 439]|nr:hypothetical protein AX16_001506 [Volvariella volvacea WC 439]